MVFGTCAAFQGRLANRAERFGEGLDSIVKSALRAWRLMKVRIRIGLKARIEGATKFEYADRSVTYWETNVGAGVTEGPGFAWLQ